MSSVEATAVHDCRIVTVTSVAVFLFYATMLSFPRGYTLGSVILLGASLYSLFRWPVPVLTRESKILFALFIGMFAVAGIGWLYHGNSGRTLDIPSRYLLTIPVFFAMLSFPPRIRWLWAGLVVGAASAAVVAWYDLYVLELPRATGTTGGIQFGNLSLMMGIFCIVGLIHVVRDNLHRAWLIPLAIGGASGLYASIASGSRGGWVALPFIGLVFLVAYTNRRNVKRVAYAVSFVVVASATAVNTVPIIQDRFNEAVSDITGFKNGHSDTSLGLRLSMYKVATTMIPEKPWLGWGEAEYNAAAAQYVKEGVIPKGVLKLANAHNTYLQTLLYQGALGFLILILFLFSVFVSFARHLRARVWPIQMAAVCGTSLVMGYGIFNLSQVMLGRNNTVLFFLISLVIFWGMLFRAQSVEARKVIAL